MRGAPTIAAGAPHVGKGRRPGHQTRDEHLPWREPGKPGKQHGRPDHGHLRTVQPCGRTAQNSSGSGTKKVKSRPHPVSNR